MKLPETIRAAFVIARRDFTATVLSKTFLLFLLGPLFPILLGMLIVGIGARADRTTQAPPVAVISSAQEFEQLAKARLRAARPDPPCRAGSRSRRPAHEAAVE